MTKKVMKMIRSRAGKASPLGSVAGSVSAAAGRTRSLPNAGKIEPGHIIASA